MKAPFVKIGHFKKPTQSYSGSLKLMGNVNCTLTGAPLILPGFQAGIIEMTLTASLSHSALIPLNIATSVIRPSTLTTKPTNTRPSVPILTAWGDTSWFLQGISSSPPFLLDIPVAVQPSGI